jgi:hypothetical protein
MEIEKKKSHSTDLLHQSPDEIITFSLSTLASEKKRLRQSNCLESHCQPSFVLLC